MRRNTSVLASVLMMALTPSSLARADETATDIPTGTLAAWEDASTAMGSGHYWVEPEVLGDSWMLALQAALDRVSSFVVLDQLSRSWPVDASIPLTTTPQALSLALLWVPRPLRATRAESAVVQPGAIPIEPVTAAVADEEGERGELLGLRITLPWHFR